MSPLLCALGDRGRRGLAPAWVPGGCWGKCEGAQKGKGQGLNLGGWDLQGGGQGVEEAPGRALVGAMGAGGRGW